ncbi:hypothetical protein FisN_8Lh072 [Fistulifera solaris]|uniref:PH domain-containing protein n=1 Tax=Fistulifera solaris TaxID=1519565 RepID=A0A1Z5JDA3_FISSO|nr:hypothetical protein FisN_8Lh072 [Fistulifera solaris]|eukprot:GAX11977.1 hypothetical protein FisN_8Lh072 [Fistulifera solaris]
MGNTASSSNDTNGADQANTTNTPMMLTLSTPQLPDDAQYLLQQFPKAVCENNIDDTVCIVSFEVVTLFLLRGRHPSRLAISVSNLAIPTTIQLHDTRVPELRLPSQSRIVFVPESFCSQTERRRALALYLAGLDETNGDSNSNNQSPPSLLPSLQATWLPQTNTNTTNDSFPLNATQPIPFQNDLFEGHCLMVIKPLPPKQDPYWHTRLFAQKKRRIVWQIQGTFRQVPQGVLYAGAELMQPMRLGLVTQGVARLLLKLVQRFHSNVHFSFGSDDELAHIVIPAFTAMEKMIVTPPFQEPPRLGDPWDEAPESMQFRKETQSTGSWNTTDTYSMEFFSMYIDLAQWKLVQLPVSGDVALQTFWGDSPVNLCFYDAPPKDKHTARNKRYAFGVQLKYLGADAVTEQLQEEPEGDNDIFRWSGSNRPKVLVQSTQNNLKRRESGVFIIDDDSTEDAYFYFDAEEMTNDLSERDAAKVHLPQHDEIDLLAQIDVVCPFWLEVCTSRGGYSKVFAIQTENEPWALWPASACEDFVRNNKWIRKQMEIHFSPRISGNEWTRRALGIMLIYPKTDLLNQLKAVKSVQANTYGELFLQQNHKLASTTSKERIELLTQGLIARAISDRHWIEEWARVYPDRIEFFHPDRSKAHFQISSITDVKSLPIEDSPNTPQFFFLGINTPGRTVYLMFRNEAQRDEWLQCLQSWARDDVSSDMISDNPAEEFMHKSTMWRCKHRRLLNCARFSFHQRLDAKEDPVELVARVLRLALAGDATRPFLEAAALLKDTTTNHLTEEKKLAFFLNLYHVMISHAFLVLGPPNWGLVWINYFNNVAYQVGDDVFSLTELEHCIIRANMAAPSQFLSRFAIPKSDYGRLALKVKDWRINFALNCGSLSNPESIILFNDKNLDGQLDAACRLYLECVTAARTSRDLVVQLPRICQWYRDDFGDTDEDILKRIRKFLPDGVRQAIKTTSAELLVRFLPYQFECRPFVSYQD